MTKDLKHFQQMKAKEGGSQSGAIYQKVPQPKDQDKDNKHKFEAEWLVKTTTGYEMGASTNLTPITGEDIRSTSAILQAYMGEVYNLLLPEHTAKMRIVTTEEAPTFVNEFNQADCYVASKIIPNVTPWKDIDPQEQAAISQGQIATNGMAELRVAGLLMGDTDWNRGNVMIRKHDSKPWQVFKIDPDDDSGIALVGVKQFTPAHFTPDGLAAASHGYYPRSMFPDEAILNGLTLYANMDKTKLKEIADKYEPLLDNYRKEKGQYDCLQLIHGTMEVAAMAAKDVESRIEQTQSMGILTQEQNVPPNQPQQPEGFSAIPNPNRNMPPQGFSVMPDPSKQNIQSILDQGKNTDSQQRFQDRVTFEKEAKQKGSDSPDFH